MQKIDKCVMCPRYSMYTPSEFIPKDDLICLLCQVAVTMKDNLSQLSESLVELRK